MKKSVSTVLVSVVMFGMAATSSMATLEILQNPDNMQINYYQAGSAGWGQWATDSLTTAYLDGTASIIDHGGYYYGRPKYMIDGAVTDWEVKGSSTNNLDEETTGCEFWQNGFVDFKFNSSYSGGRILGSSTGGGDAIRVHTNYHTDHDGFWYMLQYSTTDSPTVFHTLMEVRDTAVTAWAPRLITANFISGSTLVNNVDTIRYVQLDTNNQGLVEELNVNMVPEPATLVLLGIGIAGAIRRTK